MNIENECWSDSRPYYILYQDKEFIKNIYAQVFSGYPDIGEIAYIGATTKRLARDYFLEGEGINVENFRNKEEDKREKDLRLDNRKKAGLRINDVNEESQIREYANIPEIKEMNNMLFYKSMLRELVDSFVNKKCNSIKYINAKVEFYDSYKEGEDIFIKMDGACIWLKKNNLDTSAINILNLMGKVNMIGYIIEQETDNTPVIIKALAIYT